MKYIATKFLLLGLLLLGNKTNAQINIYRNVISDGNLKKEYVEAKNNQNEVETVFSGLFLFYKTFLSSQDLTVCTFSPSCSEYGILAVKKFGVVKGGIMTMDRLTRCNGLSPNNYEIEKVNMLLKDDPRIKPFVPVVSNLK